MDLGRRGIRSLAVARTNDEGKWQMSGILTFLDPPRPDTKETIENAMALGVDVKMITGAPPLILQAGRRAGARAFSHEFERWPVKGPPPRPRPPPHGHPTPTRNEPAPQGRLTPPALCY